MDPASTRISITSILSSPSANAASTTGGASTAASASTAAAGSAARDPNDPVFSQEKKEYLDHERAKIQHFTALDMLALSASEMDFINNEHVQLLNKARAERDSVKKIANQLDNAHFVTKEQLLPKKAAIPTAASAASATGAPATGPDASTPKKRGKNAKKADDDSSARRGKKRKNSVSDDSAKPKAKAGAAAAAPGSTPGSTNGSSTKFSNIKKINVLPLSKEASKAESAVEDDSMLDDAEDDTMIDEPEDKDEDYEEPSSKKRRVAGTHNGGAGGSKKKGASSAGSAGSSASATAATAEAARKQQEKEQLKKEQEDKTLQKEAKALEKQYDNTYITIWKDLSRKDAPKIHRIIQQSNQTRMINLKKTAILCSRESKRWQVRTNKNLKDLQTKARRGMREMFNFWKRNEREEKEIKRKIEKEILDKAKKEEEERESRRQARKLNFLITQTELYSHFIGKKIKTDEIEGTSDASHLKSQHTDIEAPVDAKKTDINSIDFDSDNEEELKKAAAANAQSALLDAQERAKQFDGNGNTAGNNELKQVNIDDDDLNFQNPTSLGDITITQPKLLNCTLKEYQVKGLNWLANLYDQGINGILADEMGLGKTVQSISVLAYLAETHNIWGPYLVVSPASTLHNWQQEITKFVPDFKVLPYWGNSKDRKVLRKFWDRKQVTYTKDSPFHVLVTSYQLIVQDIQYFQRIKWQYMILDEAQAIKSSQSSRWKSLLGLQCRNRLLLTGTPIQNSMQELWALLHFIMPSLFDNHEEFSDWFSKDIESHAQSNTQLNEQQLRRLHVILKPFMLRRIKKNVQSELGDKIEIDLYCNLTNRQKKLYKILRSQISLYDLIEKATTGSDESNQSLINLVMQFRKVCNHPDLFERYDIQTAFSFVDYAETGSFARESSILDYNYSTKNPIKFNLPKLIYKELLIPSETNLVGSKNKVLNHLLNIWDSKYISENDKENEAFTWLKFIENDSPSEVARIAKRNLIERAIELKSYKPSSASEDKLEDFKRKNLLLFNDTSSNSNYKNLNSNFKKIQQDIYDQMYLNVQESYAPSLVIAPPIDLICSAKSFVNDLDNELFNPKLKSSLNPLSLNNQLELINKHVPIDQFPKCDMLPAPLSKRAGYSTIRMPSMDRFISDSAKLAKLDELLIDLKKNDHRVLIYFQMTKMMDLMEEYLTYRQYKFIRLDGSSKLDERRDLVTDWQTKPEIFVFLLSTRAGGLGINLTAADTVIFYDSDWNPTIDSQAMDRAHRLGQTRQVTVYRLLVRGTIEERMRDRAKQKEHVQQVVMEGKSAAKDDVAAVGFQKPTREVAFWLLDDQEAASAVLKGKKLEEEKLAKRKANEAKRNSKAKKSSANNGGASSSNGAANLEDMYHEGEGDFNA